MSEYHPFPLPIRAPNGRLYWARSALERHKRSLMGLPAPNPESVEVLVPADEVCREFGFGRRSLGRRILEAKKAFELEAIDSR